MKPFVLELADVDQTNIDLVGGKCANIGELLRIEGINTPDGFCVTTAAFKRIINDSSPINYLIGEISSLAVSEGDKIAGLSTSIRTMIEKATIPEEIVNQILHRLNKHGAENLYAIRSSATAEDLPDASFAGQQDSYLNISGQQSILEHIRKCWSSLYTERAIIYRKQNGFDDTKHYMCVIVQKMVFADASGVLFTADPVTNNRKTISIDAASGAGDAVVSGLVSAYPYKVEDEKIISAKKPGQSPLNDDQVLLLARLGKKIEKHFGYPQDIEWCLADDQFYFVQSRAITTLFPVPEVNDHEEHVYISVGHQQMMTDAMKPLGISIWQTNAARPMYEAGGRLFVHISSELSSPAKREMIINGLGRVDPLVRDALKKIVQRKTMQPVPDDTKQELSSSHFDTLQHYDPSVVSDLINTSEILLAATKEKIKSKSGVDLINFIFEDIKQLKENLSNPQTIGVIMTGMNAARWINEKMNQWLDEKNVADILSLSASNNVTSEMGLALLDVADVIRPYPHVIEYLKQQNDEDFLDELPRFNGGSEAKKAIDDFLEKYGMRCAGEIDITKTRWSEKPSILVPLILTNISNFKAGESKRKFQAGKKQASEKEHDLLRRLKKLPDGEHKAAETKRMIDLLRNLIGYREYPKYSMVSRYYVYKIALLKEAERLVENNVIQEKEDIYYLTLEEFRLMSSSNKIDKHIIDKRKEEFRRFEKLKPPRVMTSDGEIITGSYQNENIPSDAIPGLAVSSGIIEGRARVIFKMQEANLLEGDILVTPFTDPSWTPSFVLIKGLVTEVGSLMSHGAVIAREYGLPAVVGVENATKLIKDGQRIRVHGTEGYVQILN